MPLSNRTLIVIQVRLDSRRLPAKAMLWTPSGPLFSVVALRAARGGKTVVVATTDDTEGGLVARVAAARSLQVYQGSKDNVLSRFVGATESLDSNDIVVRLTADNLIPDDALIDLCLRQMDEHQLDYLTTNVPGVPYGLSVETFRRWILLAADDAKLCESDKEHVTPWIARNYASPGSEFQPLGIDPAMNGLRVTIDEFDDYVTWLKVFSHRNELINVSWSDLLVDYYQSNAPEVRK